MKKIIENKRNMLIITGAVLLLILIIIEIILNQKDKTTDFLGNNGEVSFSNCTNIEVNKNITVDGTSLKREEAMEKTTPYKIQVTSTCKENLGYIIYLAIPKSKVDDSKIKYILTNKEDKNVIKEGVLGSLNNMKESFSEEEIKRINKGLDSSLEKVYILYNDFLPQKEINYDLYLYVDKDLSKDIKGNLKMSTVLKTYEIGE